MTNLASTLLARLNTPGRRKFIKYALASIISVIITQLILVFCYAALRIDEEKSSFIASSLAAIPSYFLNRNWVWRKSGKSHFRKEVLPFWIMVAIGLVFSVVAGNVAGRIVDNMETSHAVRTLIVSGSNIGAFAILWVLKYIIFNRILFVHHPQDLEPALDGRTGLPT